MKPRVLDLFSGIGGFSLGLERAGMQTAAFCEIEEFPRKVLQHHWPDAVIWKDVRDVTGQLVRESVGHIDVVCGGFPCQDISIANPNGKGLDGERSGLWREMLRVITEVRPSVVIGENVFNLLNRGLLTCLNDLEAEGYQVEAFDIPACAVGLPTMERHIWIVATTNGFGSQGSFGQALQNFTAFSRELSRSYPRDFSRWAIPASRVCGVGEGISNRVDRIRALGNAVPPPVVELIGRAIMEIWQAQQAA